MKNEVVARTKKSRKANKRATKAGRRSSSELGAVSWVEEQEAAYRFKESMVEKADGTDERGAYPMWYGWVISKAFIEGAKWERSRSSTHRI